MKEGPFGYNLVLTPANRCNIKLPARFLRIGKPQVAPKELLVWLRKSDHRLLLADSVRTAPHIDIENPTGRGILPGGPRDDHTPEPPPSRSSVNRNSRPSALPVGCNDFVQI